MPDNDILSTIKQIIRDIEQDPTYVYLKGLQSGEDSLTTRYRKLEKLIPFNGKPHYLRKTSKKLLREEYILKNNFKLFLTGKGLKYLQDAKEAIDDLESRIDLVSNFAESEKPQL